MTIYDYLEYYHDKTFNEEPFNEVDSLIFSTIAYMSLTKMPDNINFNYLYELLFNLEPQKMHGYMADKILDIVNKMKYSKRYQDIRLFKLKKLDDDRTQFGAITFRSSYFTYVAYEGSNSSIAGWLENFMLGVKYPTYTQKLATDYLNKVIKHKDKIIYVGGHSKGGNLAMVAAMNCHKRIFKKIKQIYNFDGPGFRKEEFTSNEFKIMNQKCFNYLPSFSIVGIMLYNQNYKYVLSTGNSITKHYPINWQTQGNTLVKGELSKISLKLQDKVNKLVESLNYDDTIKLLEDFYAILKDNEIIYAKDVMNINFTKLKAIINEYHEIPSETKQLFIEIIKLLIHL